MTDYEKLKNIIDEIDNLINHHVRSSALRFGHGIQKRNDF